MAGEPILIVDDNAINLKLLRLTLKVEGYDVQTAVDAEQALAVLAVFRPRLVLMDLQLPGMDGLDLRPTMRSSWPSPRTR
jgi:CheY-like chemotaxis protein